MAVTIVESDVATPPNRPYSQAVTAGLIIAVSGQTPIGADGNTVGIGDPAEQATVSSEHFTQPGPARTSVACSLAKPDYLVEIDALAEVNS